MTKRSTADSGVLRRIEHVQGASTDSLEKLLERTLTFPDHCR